MNSKEKKPDSQQRSILNFFSSSSNTNQNKRTHSDILKGELDLTKTPALKQAKVEISSDQQNVFYIFLN